VDLIWGGLDWIAATSHQ